MIDYIFLGAVAGLLLIIAMELDAARRSGARYRVERTTANPESPDHTEFERQEAFIDGWVRTNFPDGYPDEDARMHQRWLGQKAYNETRR